jgi:hypothetical protein
MSGRLLSEGTPEENAYEGYRTKVRPDTIRVLEVRSDINFRTTDVLQWQLEEGYIISSQTPLYVRELYRNEDTISFSPAFNQALAARLASELCLPITESTRKQTVYFGLSPQGSYPHGCILELMLMRGLVD